MNKETVRKKIIAAALLRDGHILLARRSPTRSWYPGLWDLPGGHVENGETEPEAVVRELSEELGILVPTPTTGALAHLYEYSESGDVLVDLSVWMITSWVGEVSNKSPREHTELYWFTRKEFPQTQIAHPEYVDMLAPLF